MTLPLAVFIHQEGISPQRIGTSSRLSPPRGIITSIVVVGAML
jgi:hypothetical protein